MARVTVVALGLSLVVSACGSAASGGNKSSGTSTPAPSPAPNQASCTSSDNVRVFDNVKKASDITKCYGLTLFDRYGGSAVFSKDTVQPSSQCKDDGYLGYVFQLLCNDAGGLVVDYGCGPGSCTVAVARSQQTCDASSLDRDEAEVECSDCSRLPTGYGLRDVPVYR
jgi:hypothetical protein